MNIEFNNKEPIYHQIINLIKKDIITGRYKGGDKMLSVREMAEKYKVNPNTISRVYQLLEMENITYTQRGMGTFITQDEDKILQLKNQMADSVIHNFINEMRSLGFENTEIINSIKKNIVQQAESIQNKGVSDQ
ncbi:UNVERIFIED_CONTAM: DNA-binding transcriptional regulator YhcF (GntR family) [Acetivibrio alkalicellulosi]